MRALRVARLEQVEDELVVGHQHERGLVHDRDVVQFFVRVAGRQNRHGGLVHRRPAHAGVQIARREGRRRHAADTGPTIEAVQELARAALILGYQPAREVERATGNVRVDVHAAGHHDHARRVDHAGARREIGVGDDAAIDDA